MMAAASKYLVGTCTCCGRPDMPLRYGGGPSGEHTYCTSTKHGGCKDSLLLEQTRMCVEYAENRAVNWAESGVHVHDDDHWAKGCRVEQYNSLEQDGDGQAT